MSQPNLQPASFWDRSNDLASRDLPSRLARFIRAHLRRCCQAGMMLADEPRVLRAWRKGWDSAHFVKLLRWRQEGFHPAIVYDIGAHEGLWSEMCQAVLAPAKCLLFEPQPEFQRRAQARQPQPPAEWLILPMALGDREEIETLHVTRNAAASSLLSPLTAAIPETEAVAESKVQVMPLDRLVTVQRLPLPDLVKVDVQGFEGRVLAGGRETLRHARKIVVEVSLHALYQGQSLLPDVLATLTEWGFELDDMHETFRQWPGRLWQVDLWMQRPPKKP